MEAKRGEESVQGDFFFSVCGFASDFAKPRSSLKLLFFFFLFFFFWSFFI